MPETFTLGVKLSLDGVDIDTGEVLGTIESDDDESTVRMPLEDVLGWTTAREERILKELNDGKPDLDEFGAHDTTWGK